MLGQQLVSAISCTVKGKGFAYHADGLLRGATFQENVSEIRSSSDVERMTRTAC